MEQGLVLALGLIPDVLFDFEVTNLRMAGDTCRPNSPFKIGFTEFPSRFLLAIPVPPCEPPIKAGAESKVKLHIRLTILLDVERVRTVLENTKIIT